MFKESIKRIENVMVNLAGLACCCEPNAEIADEIRLLHAIKERMIEHNNKYGPKEVPSGARTVTLNRENLVAEVKIKVCSCCKGDSYKRAKDDLMAAVEHVIRIAHASD